MQGRFSTGARTEGRAGVMYHGLGVEIVPDEIRDTCRLHDRRARQLFYPDAEPPVAARGWK
ncbi:MAG: hypothetical protein DI616_07235 [Paracoccus denitrificans]|uniref:Uncharacterized protein n=1 Tax=Paracoccus denitrificans TaxID=266 RepID=A0A533I766_PARDE|nr:MAG: hypothetical protein DI616_07235 [Paracoccus denitrificans]